MHIALGWSKRLTSSSISFTDILVLPVHTCWSALKSPHSLVGLCTQLYVVIVCNKFPALFFYQKNQEQQCRATIVHPIFCVSRPWAEFGWVIRIQNAPDDFVPGKVPLRQKKRWWWGAPDLFVPGTVPLRISDWNFCLKCVPWVRKI